MPQCSKNPILPQPAGEAWIDQDRVEKALNRGTEDLVQQGHTPDKPLRLAILASGRGTNARAIWQAWQSGLLGPVEPCLLLADKACPAVHLAQEYGIRALVFPSQEYRRRRDQEKAMIREIEAAAVDLLALAGYMRLLTPDFVAAYYGRLLNIHPALLPLYPGTDAIARAYAAGETISGPTLHLVDQGMDTGPRLAQKQVVRGDLTADAFETRIHEAEHQLYPQVLARYGEALIQRLAQARTGNT